MNDDVNKEILIESRKTRQLNQIMAYFVVLLVIAGAVVIVFEHKQFQNARNSRQQENPWSKVDVAWYQLDYPKALSLSQSILSEDTNNDWGYAYLGHIYLRMGNLTNAETAYKRAYQLYPSKENEDALTVIQKRIAMEQGNQSQSK